MSRFLQLALLLLPILANATHSHAQDTGDVTNIVQIDELEQDGPYQLIWEPYIAKWSRNHYICCYGKQLNRKPDMGDIVCSISRDKGESWSPPTMVFDHSQRNGTVQYAYNNSVLYHPPGQDIVWLFVMRVPMHYKNSENAQIVAAYTADGGYSWHHVEVAMDYQAPLIIVAGIHAVERDGVTHYLLPAHRNTARHDRHGDRRQFVLESTSLLYWKLAGYVPYSDEHPAFLHEGNIAPLGEDRLKMVMRTASVDREQVLDPPLAFSSTSDDGGETWSTAQPEPDLPNFRSKAFYGRDASNRHIYVYSDDVNRHGLWYKLREDKDDAKWSDHRKFYFDNNRNSYPTLIEEKPKVWAAVWDSSDSPDQRRTAIRFGRLDLND